MITKWRWPIIGALRQFSRIAKSILTDGESYVAIWIIGIISGIIGSGIACAFSAICGWTTADTGNGHNIQFWTSSELRPGFWILIAFSVPLILALLWTLGGALVIVGFVVVGTLFLIPGFLKLFIPIREKSPQLKDLRDQEIQNSISPRGETRVRR